MVRAWNHVIDPHSILARKLSSQVFEFLQTEENKAILSWLDDSYSLVEHAREAMSSLKTSMEYYDYSFMITPAFKALELWLINIAPHLGVEAEAIKKAKDYGSFSFLADKHIQDLVDNVVNKLDDKSKKEKSLRSSLNALSSYLTNLRHTPAHCSEVIPSQARAETIFNQIVGAIDDITLLLIKEGVIQYQIETRESTGRTLWTNAPKH